MRLDLRAGDLAALDAAGAALLDVATPAAELAGRLVAALGPALGVESAWGMEQAQAPGAAALVPTPFADAASPDLAAALAHLAEVAPADVRLRERAASEAAVRLLAGTPRRTWHLEEMPELLGPSAYAAFRRTAVHAALFAPGRGATASGFVSTAPGVSGSLVLSRRTPDRGARRARARALLGLLGPAVHARHALRAHLAAASARPGGDAAAADAVVDLLAAPALLFAPDGREVHRNAALDALLADPRAGGERVLHALRAAGAGALTVLRSAEGARRRGRPLGAGPDAGLDATLGPALHAAAVPWAGGQRGVLVVLGPPPATPPAPAASPALAAAATTALTPREREVAALLAERRTNAEIARALAVSVHTVRRHVEAVLRKLDVRSRLEVRARLGPGRA